MGLVGGKYVDVVTWETPVLGAEYRTESRVDCTGFLRLRIEVYSLKKYDARGKNEET
jgi:hypothetical protein